MGRGGNAGGTEVSPSKPRDPKMQSARVKLLDGIFKDFELHRGSEGECLFQMVCSDLSIEEKDYFSLCFYDKDGLRHWLYNDKKILRQLKGLPWEFSYEVKFYPVSPSSLNDDHARFNMFLQLKNDILSERLPATLPTQAGLGALVVQAKYGDADSSAEYEQFLKESRLAPNVTPQLMEQIRELHKETKGQTAAEAECNYIDQCKQLSKYGVFLYSAKDDHNQAVDVGICATGINIYQEAIRIHRFHWQNINKISFRRNTFSVKLNAGEMGKKETTLTYKVHDYAMAKRVWKCGVEHHTFFRLIQPDDKSKTGLFRFGSTKFRYQGRTQFQSKMASQMFDSSATNTVQRHSRLTQSCEEVCQSVPVHQTTDLAYTKDELELQPMPRSEQSYDISSSQEKRTSLPKVGEAMERIDDDDDLVYTPADSPYSAAYYISGRTSSTRSPISFGTTSPHGSQQQHQRSVQQPILRVTGARRNLFGRTSTSSDTVRLVSFHEPLDYSSFLPTTRLSDELNHIPINDTVQLYHKGHYTDLSSVSGRSATDSPPEVLLGYPEIRAVHQINGFGQQNELSLDNDAPQHPIRFFVDLNHSGQSLTNTFERLVHEGKEEIIESSEQYFLPIYQSEVAIRLEKKEELPTFNIRQFSKIYHNFARLPSAGNRILREVETRPIRLIAKVRRPSHVINETHSSNTKHYKQNRHSPKTQTLVTELTSTTEPTEERRFLYIARVRHEGEEEFVDKTDVKPESYGVASTSYDGPLEETTREVDLDHAPIHDHSSIYHPGHSLSTDTKTLTKSEVIDDKNKKKAILHLKSTQKVENVREETEEKKGLLIARVPHDENEEPLPVREKAAKSSRYSQGSGRFGFWKSPSRKSKTISELSDYPITDKYKGPLDSVNRQNDIDSLPLESHLPEVAYSPKTQTLVTELTSTTEPTEERRFLYIARVRHEGEEEFVDKTDVKPQSYGVASTSYDGPLEETTREVDLDHAPIHDHSSIYHPGHSLSTDTKTLTKTEVIDDKNKKKAILHLKSSQKVENVREETEEKKGLLIARVPHDENEEPLPVREKAAKSSRYSQGSGRFGFWKSPNRKSKTISELSDYPITDKYKGPLDSVNRQNDIDSLPLESHLPEVAYSPKTQALVTELTSTTEPTEERQFLYIARVRHEGEEEFVDKTHVKPDSYGVASTSYDGPLEETTREVDLDHAPIHDHSSIYHPGHSLSTDTKTLTKTEVIDDKNKKKAILHLKSTQKVENVPEETEEKKVLLIARIPHDENEEPLPVREKAAKPSRDSQGSGRFSFWKSPGRKSKTISESSVYPTTDKYEGPLDSVNRQNDMDSLPLESHLPKFAYSPKTQTLVTELTSTTEPTEERRFLYIARVRHEGEEEFVDKTHVKPESYGVASTSYDGPLEETTREVDLDHAPIHDHSSIYHPGHSLPTDTKTLTKTEVIDDKNKKKAMWHLKSTQKVENIPEEKEEKKVLLIARIPHDKNEEPLPVREKAAKPSRDSQGSGRLGFWKSPGRKSKTISESSDYPTTDKYEGPLDSVKRQNDLDCLPLESHLPEVAYSPKTQTLVTELTSTTEPTEERRFLYIARVRHEGEDELVDKTDVKPESYGVASTLYDGPFEETTREVDLDHAPIHDHSSIYHPGHSLSTDTKTLTKSEVIDDKNKKKALLHLKSTQKVENVPGETEEKKVLLIARIPHDENEEPLPVREKAAKPSRDSQGSGRFGFWKSPGRKSKTISESSDYPTTDKYEGPLDSVNRQNDMDSLPLESHLPEIAYSPKTQTLVTELTSTTEPTEERRFLYIARVRHEGEEEFVDKTDVKPESYGVASTSYDGPLEETTREVDLDHAPIHDHSSIYHPGHSLSTDTKTLTKSEVIDDKNKKKAILHLKSTQKVENVPEETEEKKVLLIARIPHDENEEPLPVREKAAKPSRDSQGSGRFGFWKSPGRKSKTISESSDYPTTDKYEGPLELVNRQNDMDSPPLESHLPEVAYSPKTQALVTELTSTTDPTEERRFLYIARVRHEGEDEFVDKTDVKPESYGVASTSYDGPLEETTREVDLNHAPIHDHSSIYHPGHSLSTDTKTLTKSEVIDDKNKKEAILHLKSTQKVENVPEETEEKKVLLIARIPYDENEEPLPVREKAAKPSRDSQGSGRLGFWKSPGRKSKTISESSDYPTTDKYEGPLDSVKRQNDLDCLPLESHLPEVAYSPKTQTLVTELTSTTEPTEERRFLYIARVRHEGEEEFVDKTDVKPESYGVASTSYDGPLEETTREVDLDRAPIHDHSSIYHPGHSLSADTKTLTKSEVIDDKNKKKAILHLKSTQKVENVPEETEEKKVLLIARIPHDENEEPLPLREKAAKQSRDSQGSGRFGFWKSPGRKSKTISESSDYPTTDKYEGPLDSVNRQNDMDSLPLESHLPEVAYSPKTQTLVTELTSTTEPTEERRFLYIARVRHEGEEEFVDKTDVKPESYGVASTSYDGPLEETTREVDLDHAPIHDHSSIYHPGHSLSTDTKTLTKSEVIDDKNKKKAILHLKSTQKVENVPEETEEKKVLLIARIPHDENEETLPVREKAAKPSRDSQGSGRFGFWKSPGRKSKTISESSDYPTTDKYEGPLELVNRQNDMDSLPLESHLPEVAYSPKTQALVTELTSTTDPTEERRFLYIARVRHEGEDEFVDKTDVKPESYGVASTSYDGPLEETTREVDLDHAPIHDHSSIYHPGHSLSTDTKTLTKTGVIDDKNKKKAILHLKSTQKVENVPEEEEEKKVLLIARIPHDENEEPLPVREKAAKRSRDSQGSGRFGFWKSPGRKSKTISESSDYPTTDKYESPLELVNRQNDMDSLPLESHLPEVAYSPKTQALVTELTSTTDPTEERRFLYIARVRHEGEDEFVDKTDVKPESYGVASTSYDGPLEETTREVDLDHAPIHDHSSIYHPGHSLSTDTKTLTKSEVIDDKNKKKAILHLKSTQKVENVPEEKEEKKVLLIARIPHDENEEPLPVREKAAKPSRDSQGSGRFGFWKSPGRKSKTISESSDYPTTDKYESPLELVNRQNDMDSLPLESHLPEVAYSPKTQALVTELTSTTDPTEERRFLYIARVRHEGEDEFVDKTDVKPESYGVASTSYDGPLEETTREVDLDHAPIHDHSSIYHPGHSLSTDTKTLTKSEVIDDKNKKKAILHLKSTQKVENVPEEKEEKKVLLIARIPHDENEEPLPVREKAAKPSRDSQGSGRFGFWKSPGRKSKTISESSDYPTTDKYEGPLDSVKRQNDLDCLPLESHLAEVAYSPKTQTLVTELTSTTEPTEERRFLYIARVRHEGEEEFVDKTDVKPESYGVASTSYDGPLEETTREVDLDHAPIHDHSSIYHPGHSLSTDTKTLTKSEVIDDKNKKKAILHLKSTQKVENVPEEKEEKKVLSIARIPHDENEEPLPVREKAAKPSRDSQGSGRFGFWKSPGRKSKTISESSDYPTTDKYEGPLDSVKRQNDLDCLPLESHLAEVAYSPKTQTLVTELTSTTEPTEERRFLYIARVRHEGEEEFVDKTDVKPESYGVASTSYDGPLEETTREVDLDHAPIHDHSSIYHPGHSLSADTKTLTKSEVIDDKNKKKAILHLKSTQKVENVPEETEEKKVLLIARIPHDENEEPLPVREKAAKQSRDSQGSGRFAFWKSPGRKSKTISESSDYPTTDKYEGPLDSVNRQNDMDSLPLESHLPEVAYSPKTQTLVTELTSTTEPTEERRFLYIARVRHEGEEEFVDKTDVKPESYGVASTSYDGPLEETTREVDLYHAPIHDHSSIYHPGHSLSTDTKTLTKTGVIDDKNKKKAILHLKSTQKVENVPEEKEEKKLLLIARIPHDENEEPLPVREKAAKQSRDSQGSGRFGFWKSPGRKSKTISESSDYPNTDKYEGPLDSVNRQNDMDSLPLESHLPEVAYSPKTQTLVTELTSTTEPTEERRFLYIARVRHEGEEELVDKTDVKPESYGVASTSYDGPLEETTREVDLDHAPIHDHSSIYHPGHSLSADTKTLTKSEVIDDKNKKKAILHLKSTQKVENVPEETEEKKVLLIARIPHDENEEPLPVRGKAAKPSRDSQGSGRFGFWKSPGRKSETISESSDYPNTDKYEGPLELVNRQNDMDSLPLEIRLPEVAYSPKTQALVTELTSTTEPTEERQFLYIARVRHEGEDEFVDKTDVKPESYGVASTLYDGPLEETTREVDLDHAPIHDHSSIYHPGHSLSTDTKTLTKSELIDDKNKKKAILHLKSTQKVENVPEEKEEKKVLLIARIPHDENEEPLPVREKAAKPSRDSQGSGRFGFWKSPGRKSKTISESSDYPTTDKYEGPLDSVKRQNDLDCLPLESHLPEVAYSPKTQTLVTELTSTTEPTEERRFLYIARVRHEGEEEFVDKTDVKPESYGVASTSYDGPLEETTREVDLDHAPIHDHSSIYHPGHSLSADTKTLTKSEVIDDKNKKKAILHLKSTQKVENVPEETEEKKVLLIARIPHDENEEPLPVREKAAKQSRDSQGSGRFGFWKSPGRKSKTISESSDYPTTDKYEGPLDSVNRQNDIDSLPLESHLPEVAYSPKTQALVTELTSTTDPTEERRFLYIARVRHEGEDEFVDKTDVKPESYGVASTSYDGPLEETTREVDLDRAPIHDHSSIYHPGHSLSADTKTLTKSEVIDDKNKKKAILHLKSTQKVENVPEETEEKKVLLIARIPHDENEEPLPLREKAAKQSRDSQGSGRFGFWKSPGRKSKTISESSDYPTTDKYEGPLDSVNRENDMDSLPLESHLPEVAYSPKINLYPLANNEVDQRFISSYYHKEGTTVDGQQFIEVRLERRVEVQLDPVYCLSGAGLGAVSEDAAGIIFTSTPPPMPSSVSSFFGRFGFKSKKTTKSKGVKETDSSDSSSSDDEHRHVVTAVVGNNEYELLGKKECDELSLEDLKAASMEDQHLQQHTVIVPEGAVLPFLAQKVSCEETGPEQPLKTVASWQETSILPDDVTIEYDEHGNKITRTVKTSKVKHTVQKQTVQSYMVPNENTPGVVSVEHSRDVMTPVGVIGKGPILETHSRSVVYEGQPISAHNEDMGEFVSSKTITTGNRTVETVTYKRERNGIIETHVEHRVTIHSNTDIDHDAELSAAITEATQMNPDMIVEKIEVRQETSN